MAIDYSKLRLALKHLEAQLANYQNAGSRPELTQLDREGLRESVIQRFETAYDTCWKLTKKHLEEALGLAEAPSSPKPVLRLANENRLLDDRIEAWLAYADARVATAHDYSGEKAEQTVAVVPGFLADAVQLYGALTGETWN